MPELLIELLSEEIPARMQARAAAELRRLVVEGLGLPHEGAEAFATPRRLALVVRGLPARQPDRATEVKGPRVGAPEKAIQGFLKSRGLASIDQCRQVADAKGAFYVYDEVAKGLATGDLVARVLAAALADFPWPKSMRWGAGAARWVRPLQGILCVFDGRVVPVAFAGIEAGDITRGHRFLGSFPKAGDSPPPPTPSREGRGDSLPTLPLPSREGAGGRGASATTDTGRVPGPIKVADFDDYRAKLRAAHVILDGTERKALILERARALAAAGNLSLVEDDGLADENAGLTEWPVVLVGGFDEAFLDVPPEVLTTTMRAHQKYFALARSDGRLANRFVLVANTETADGGKAIIAGNERVLRARLSDARFFWDQDRKRTLDSRVAALDAIVYHARLGSVGAKVARVERLAVEVATYVPGCDVALVRRAARLAKADLTSGMVGEFPELQGIMGRYYAGHDGEAPAVAQAIAEHYAPQGPNDRCPTAPLSVAVALADKIDTLVGFFAIDEKPTGSRDPFALRRAALGVIRLVLENGLRLPLRDAFDASARGYAPTVETSAERITAELLEFFADRLKVHLRDEGVRHDTIGAVFAKGDDDLVRVVARARALQGFLAGTDGGNLLTAYRRAGNIVRIEAKRDGRAYDGASSPGKFASPQENALKGSLDRVANETAKALGREAFEDAMGAVASLRGPVDAFFDGVTVNAEDRDLRENRLRLLAEIQATLDGIADFSKIEG